VHPCGDQAEELALIDEGRLTLKGAMQRDRAMHEPEEQISRPTVLDKHTREPLKGEGERKAPDPAAAERKDGRMLAVVDLDLKLL